MSIRVLVNGAAGKMGLAMAGCVMADPDLELAAAVDVEQIGCDPGLLAAGCPWGLRVSGVLTEAIGRTAPDVMLDFTRPEAVRQSLPAALSLGVACVVGTTGLSEAELAAADALARARRVGVVVAPNFALTAVLLGRFAAEAAGYFPDYELIEAHHDKKLDAPSGTALALVRQIGAVRRPRRQGRPDEYQALPGCRGADWEGARIHSLRLPGVLARHEIIFGGPGQTLTLRQECSDRQAFWPGVRLALLRVGELRGLIQGLDQFI